MGDTADGSWGSRELGGFIRREEAARDRKRVRYDCRYCDGTGVEPAETSEYPPEPCSQCPAMRPDEVVPFLLRVLVHLALMQDEPEDVYGPAYDCVTNALWEIERGQR